MRYGLEHLHTIAYNRQCLVGRQHQQRHNNKVVQSTAKQLSARSVSFCCCPMLRSPTTPLPSTAGILPAVLGGIQQQPEQLRAAFHGCGNQRRAIMWLL